MFTLDEIDQMFADYLACAVWSSSDVSPTGEMREMDAEHDVSDFAEDTLRDQFADLIGFLHLADEADLRLLDVGQVGHDFWLTRNHHGAGFWDRGIGAAGDRLTEWAESMGGSDLYVGDDGLIHST